MLCYSSGYGNTPSGADLKSLFSSVGWAECLTEQELFDAIRVSSHSVVVYDADVLVGFIRSMDDGIYSASIDLLVVRPNYQHKGIGSELLRHLLSQIEHIRYISVSPNDKSTFRLYERFGFVEMTQGGYLQKV